MLSEEMRNARIVDANSILEWRLTPRRLDDILTGFLEDSFAEEPSPRAKKRSLA